MRVLIDGHVFDVKHQGTRTYLKGLYSELIALKPDTDFFFAGYDLPTLKAEIGEHPNVHFVQLKFRRFLRLLVEFPFLIWKHKIDYAHFQYVTPPLKNCRHIVTIHDVLFRDFPILFPLKYRLVNDFLFGISARRADVLLTVSNYSRQRIREHYGIPLHQIHITPNGVSRAFTNSSSIADGDWVVKKYGIAKFILYVSRIEPRKNHILLLRAFQELKLWKHNYSLVFVGRRDFGWTAIDKIVAEGEKEFQDSIVQLENVDDEELVKFYRSADLFVYPSLAEGFGIPPIEALASGTTTLCSGVTAMSDFTFLGDDLFDPTSVEELKKKVADRLLKPVDEERRMALQQLVTRRYTWRNSALVLKACLEA
jgi:glycosyltransferase involved in cell wall biosynthesis